MLLLLPRPSRARDRYKVLFYAEVIDARERLNWIIDSTNWVSIPPPELILSISPSYIDLRQGHESTVEVRVNSSSGSELMTELSPQELSDNRNNQRDFDLQFEVEELRISPYSMGASRLHITTFPYTDVGPHTIVVSGKNPPNADLVITKNESEQKSNSNNDGIPENFKKLTPELPPSVTDEIDVEETALLIKVDKWGLDDQIKAIIDEWFVPITAVYTTIVGIISGILGWIYGRRRKKGNNNSRS